MLKARHAEENGASAIACLPPLYNRPDNMADLLTYCAAVAKAAPKTPFLYYHFPDKTGVSCELVNRLMSLV